MTPQNQNILDVLNLLVLLFRAQKNRIPKMTDEEIHTLKITSEHLSDAGLTIPVFINTIETLAQKGYLQAVSIFEKEYHQKVREVLHTPEYDAMLAQLSNLNINRLTIEQKAQIADAIQRMMPPTYQFDRAGLLSEEITIQDILSDAKKVIGDHKDTDVSIIVLMPFRSIEYVLDKMNHGVSFNEIKDPGIRYDANGYKFIIDNETISTVHQGKPNQEHYVLAMVQGTLNDGVVGYEDVGGFTHESLEHALRKFVRKHPRLKEIFKVKSDRLEFDKQAFL